MTTDEIIIKSYGERGEKIEGLCKEVEVMSVKRKRDGTIFSVDDEVDSLFDIKGKIVRFFIHENHCGVLLGVPKFYATFIDSIEHVTYTEKEK